MASELIVNLPSLSYIKGTISINVTPSPNPLVMDVTGENSMHDVIVLTTTDTSINKGNITTIGWVYVKNLDATNNIQLGYLTATYGLLLKPGEYATFRWNSTAFWAKASGGTPLFEYAFIEA